MPRIWTHRISHFCYGIPWMQSRELYHRIQIAKSQRRRKMEEFAANKMKRKRIAVKYSFWSFEMIFDRRWVFIGYYWATWAPQIRTFGHRSHPQTLKGKSYFCYTYFMWRKQSWLIRNRLNRITRASDALNGLDTLTSDAIVTFMSSIAKNVAYDENMPMSSIMQWPHARKLPI